MVKRQFTKKEHYVPQMYLKHFTIDGNYCYTLTNSNEIYHQNKKDICKKDNLYEMRTESGGYIERNKFENMFSEIERLFEPFVKELLKLRNNSEFQSFIKNDKAKECLCLFSLQLIFRNELTVNLSNDALRDILKIPTDNNVSLYYLMKIAFGSIIPHYEQFAESHAIIMHYNLTKTPFITSSFPVLFYPELTKTNKNWMDRFWHLPFSPNHLIIFVPKKFYPYQKDVMVKSTEEFVQLINETYASYGHHILISNSKETLQQLQKIRRERHA